MRVPLSVCWLGAALLAAGRSLPRLRLPYRGETGRGHLLRAGGWPGWGVLTRIGVTSALPAAGPRWGSGRLRGGRCARSAGLWVFWGEAPCAGGSARAGVSVHTPPSPRGTRGASEEEEEGGEPGDGEGGCAAGLRASLAASTRARFPRGVGGKLRHGADLAPARSAMRVAWVLPRRGHPCGCSASCPSLSCPAGPPGAAQLRHPVSPAVLGCWCWGALGSCAGRAWF